MIDEMQMTTTVAASVEDCYEIVTDIESYPEWATGMDVAVIDSVDDRGRPQQATFNVAALGRATSYQLSYDHAGAPHRIAWRLIQGDIMRRLDGHYAFAPLPSDPARTEVTFELAVELAVTMPGFVKRRAERRISHGALADFAARVEAGREH